MDERFVGVLGATSLVGRPLLQALARRKCIAIAFSRSAQRCSRDSTAWRRIELRAAVSELPSIALWISVAPIWVLPNHFRWLEAHGVRRIVALSSTSLFTKNTSPDLKDRELVQRLVQAERALQQWALAKGVEYLVLRPTMIYGLGADRNVTEIARLIERFGFFPLLGKGAGQRQPVHAADVAEACAAALLTPALKNRAYDIAGGEILTYREMVARIFKALDRKPRFVRVPPWAFRGVIVLARRFARYSQWTVSMAARMEQHLLTDHADAVRDLGWAPRAFALQRSDLVRAQAHRAAGGQISV